MGIVGYFSVSYLKRNAQLIVEDSIPGLAHAASANSSLARAYNNLLLLLTAETEEHRAEYAAAVASNSDETSRCLESYARCLREGDSDSVIYDNLVRERASYLKIRAQVMDHVAAGRSEEALRVFRLSLRPAYESYHRAGEQLLEYNIQVSSARGKEITTICNVTQVMVACVGILLFLAGFLLGFSR